MKILLVHNYYGSSAPSGENKVFEAERVMLAKHGHEVRVYTRHSDEIRGTKVKEEGEGEQRTCRFLSRVQKLYGLIKGAVCTVANPFAARAVAKICREFKPDVVHFHNTFPLISPLVVRTASKYAPVVMTLHNYRTMCAAGVPTRGGRVCSLCLDKRCVWDGVKHRCYRGSLLATLSLAVNIAIYRRLLPKWVSRFIVLSEFQKRKMVEYGWPEEKIVVKGNFISRVERVERVEKKDQIVYVGRLSEEKGVETLIKAFKLCNYNGGGIIFLGLRSSGEVRCIMRESKMVVLPSEWWETFGLTMVEAMQTGTPVVVSNLGALPEIVK